MIFLDLSLIWPAGSSAVAVGRKLSDWDGGRGWGGRSNHWSGGWGHRGDWEGGRNRGWGGKWSHRDGGHRDGGQHGGRWGRKLSGFERAWSCQDGHLVGELSCLSCVAEEWPHCCLADG